MNNTPDNQKSPFRAPSARVTAALAAAMLGIGVAVGAAIGPAPSPSQASSSLPGLLATLARAASARAAAQQASSASTQPTASTAEAAPTRKRRRRVRKAASSEEATSAATTTPAETETTTPAATKPKSTTKASTLAPVTHVWLIELSGPSFAQALAQPAAAPYIDTEAIAAGTLLSGWSGIDGSGFATDAALVAGSPPQLLDTIVQPPCPEGAAGAACTSETGELTTADEFLKATIPTITSSAAFRENGLIVVTFASVASATETGLPAGATTATLTSQPPAGVLLISPFVGVGAKSAASFNPTSPKQSLEELLRR
jgi:hypothetical protein